MNLNHDFFKLTNALQNNKTNISLAITDSNQKDSENRSAIFNQPLGSKANPRDLALKGQTLTPELIANDLSQRDPSQIAEFPLQEYSREDLLVVFSNLSDKALEKVMANIKPENIKTMFEKFFPFEYETILERLSQQTQVYVKTSAGISE